MSLELTDPPGVFGLPGLISQAAVVDGERLVYLSGQVAWDDEGAFVGVGDHGAQVVQIVRRIDALLSALGTSRASVVKETIYVVDHRPELVPAILGPLRQGVPTPPTSTLVGVAGLYTPEALVEIEVVAVLPR